MPFRGTITVSGANGWLLTPVQTTHLNPGDAGLTDENEIPALAGTAVTIAGDIWCLGPHRVACGDSTDAGTVKALLGDVIPTLMVTDPPYGVDYDPEWRNQRGLSSSSRTGKVHNDERADWSAAWAHPFRGYVTSLDSLLAERRTSIWAA